MMGLQSQSPRSAMKLSRLVLLLASISAMGALVFVGACSDDDDESEQGESSGENSESGGGTAEARPPSPAARTRPAPL